MLPTEIPYPSSLITFSNVLLFSVYKSFTSLIKFFLGVLVFQMLL